MAVKVYYSEPSQFFSQCTECHKESGPYDTYEQANQPCPECHAKVSEEKTEE